VILLETFVSEVHTVWLEKTLYHPDQNNDIAVYLPRYVTVT